MTTLRVYLTYDIDQDDANLTAERTVLQWRGLEEIPAIDAALRDRGMVHTFFLRVDNQINDEYGSYVAMYDQHRSIWEALRANGSELAWHPHLYEKQGDQYVPLRAPDQCCDILHHAWAAIGTLDFPVKTVRIGEAWNCTETMALLDRFGLRIDSTAVPGRQRDDGVRQFDWLSTTNDPYHPSAADYRVPGTEDALGILEVPMTTWPIRTDYDQAPLRRYLNPTFHPKLFRAWVDGFLGEIDRHGCHHLVIIFHPDELLTRPHNGLHAYGWDAFTNNLDYLAERLASSGRAYQYCCLHEALN